MTIPGVMWARPNLTHGDSEYLRSTAAPAKQIALLRRFGWLLPVVFAGPMWAPTANWITKRVAGPSAEGREKMKSSLWGRVENAAGQSIKGNAHDAERLHVDSDDCRLGRCRAALAVAAASRFLDAFAGFGADFITKFWL